jgi:multidrug resistance efflux pump
MLSKLFKSVIVFLAGVMILTACGSIPGSTGEPTPTAVPFVEADTRVVSEGRLMPYESTQLSFFSAGQVDEVLVEEGDQVKKGDVLARLGNREELESTIANAQVELLAAQQALKSLTDDLPEAQTAALQALNDARDGLRDAERKMRGFDVPPDQIDVDVARANLALAKKSLEAARKKYKPYENKPENDYRRATYLSKLADAQDRYDGAERELNRLIGVTPLDFELEQAQTELDIAQAKLQQAQDKHELLKNGPDPDDVANAEARITATEASLAAAKAALSHLELVATIDGTVVSQDLIVGQQVSVGQAVMTVADLSKMYAETDDLTEIEVVRISEGQVTKIAPDALPDLELGGKVESINKIFEEKRGDVTYTTRILLDKVDPSLRWGMTVAITFEE